MKNKSQILRVLLTSGLLLGGLAAQAADQIICIKSSHAPVLEDNMKVFAFSAERFESVAPFQGWGTHEKVLVENGVNQKYIRAQFSERNSDNNKGWIKASYLKDKAKCPDYLTANKSAAFGTKVNLVATYKQISAQSGSGLSDANCCRFPFASSAKSDYTTGMRQFGWGRRIKGGGVRKHAASDLWHRSYEPVYAVADGEVLRDRTGVFAGDTTATEIRHKGGFIVRYAEIATKVQKPGLVVPKMVKKGDLIGYIRLVRGALSPMLHLELYKGTVVGSLTTPPCKSGSFCRRSDLVNSAPYLQKWEASL